MRKISILVLIMFLSLVRIVEAQPDHPHLFFDSSTIPSIREKASDTSINKLGFSSKILWDKIISEAQLYFQNQSYSVNLPSGSTYKYNISDPLGYPNSHPTDPDYPVWTGLSRSIEMAFIKLALAYIVTDNITYAQKLKNFTISLAGWNNWTDPEYSCGLACLDTAHFSIGMALSYDLVYNILDSSERTNVRNAIINKGIIPLYDNTKTWTTQVQTYHNHYALSISGLGLAAISIMGDGIETEEWINYSANSTIKYFESNGNSGTTIEGQEYGSYALDNLIMLVEALKFNNKRDLYNQPFIQNLYKFPIYFLSPDGKTIANFGDSTYEIYEFWSTSMSLIASRTNNPLAQWYLAKTKLLEKTSMYAAMGKLWFNDSITPIDPAQSLPLSMSFNDIGHAALRTGWNNNDCLFAFKSGFSIQYSHLHLDQNSFMFNLGGNWLSTDPGYQDYTPNTAANNFTFGSVGHNTILVDQNFQNTSSGITGNMNGSIEGTVVNNYYDYFVGEAANAYSKYDINQFSRHVLFVKPKYFLILDDIKSSVPHQYDFLIHTDNSGDIFENLNDYFIRKQNDQILIKQYSSVNLNSNILFYPGAEGYGPYLDTNNQINQNNIKLLTFLYPEKIIGSNLLSNPSFERYTTTNGIGDIWDGRWQGSGGFYGVYSIDETISHSGSRSQKLYSSIKDDDGYIYQTVPVTEGKNYTLIAWIKTESVQERCGSQNQWYCSVYAHIWFANSTDGGLGSDTYASNETFIGTHDWTQTFLTIKAPPKAAKAKIVLELWGNGTAWFDDVSFKEVTEEVYTPPVINFDSIYNNGDVTGGIINYDNTTDAVIINPENSLSDYSTSIGNITSDANIVILRNPDKLESFAINNGTKIYYNDSLIFDSQNNATAVFEKKGSSFDGFVNTSPGTVKIYNEKPVYSVSINNENKTFSYSNNTLTLLLNEPFSEINIQFEGECKKVIKPNDMIAVKITVPSTSLCDKELKLEIGGIIRSVKIGCK